MNNNIVVAQPESEATRYTRRSILRSEKMYGEGFQSPGKIAAVEGFCARLDMRPGMRILDIGSGLGGAAFYFADRYQADVLGLDVARAMIEISTERKEARGLANVSFQESDIRTHQLPADSFDLAWTRDAILYLPEKELVWQRVFNTLKPGGQLFITDFCRSKAELSPEFAEYLQQCCYYLQDIDQYADSLRAVGFEVQVKEDITAQFIDSLEREREELTKNRALFLGEYDEADYQYLVERWHKKIKFCREGGFRWGLFIARKL